MDSKAAYQLTITGVRDATSNKNQIDPVTSDIVLFPGGVILPNLDGQYVFEAESYDEILGETIWVADTTRGNPSGGIGMVAPNGAGGSEAGTQLRYFVQIAETGTHIVWYRASGDNGNDDSFWFWIDGARPAERASGNQASMSGFSGQLDYVWVSNAQEGPDPFSFEVAEAGPHVLAITRREDGSFIDKIIITKDPAYRPTDQGPPESPRSESTPKPNPRIDFLTNLPDTLSGQELAPLTLTIEVAAFTEDQPTTEIIVNWVKNGEIINGAGGFSYTTPPLSLEDDGAQYSAIVRMPGLRVQSTQTTLSVVNDTASPQLTSITGNPFNNGVTLLFDENLDPATAGDPSRYTITKASDASALTVTQATLLSSTRVHLTTANQAPGSKYLVKIQGVLDQASTPNPSDIDSFFVSFVEKIGGLTYLFYEYASGGLNGFYQEPRGIGQFPSNFNSFGADFRSRQSWVTPYLEVPNTGNINTAPANDIVNNYGLVVFGKVVPQVSGTYRFFLASDDSAELYLSSNSNPANAVLIATEPTNNSVRQFDDGTKEDNWSAPIALTAGQEYYIEAIKQEGGGGDNLSVAWTMTTDGSTPPLPANGSTPIPGNVLKSFLPQEDDISILSQIPAPDSTTVFANAAKINVQFEDGASFQINPDQIGLTLNEQSVPPVISFDANNKRTTVSYAFPDELPFGMTYNVVLTYQDNTGASRDLTWSFTTETIPVIPPSWATPLGTGTERGFTLRSEQGPATPLRANNVDAAEGQLATPPVPASIFSGNAIAQIINFAQDDQGTTGYFGADNGYPDMGFVPAGLMSPDHSDNISMEIIAYLELTAGFHHFGVNSDDGFRFTVSPFPQDNALELGIFNAGRGATRDPDQSSFRFKVLQDGLYAMRMIWFEGSGGANVELHSRDSNNNPVLINDPSKPEAIKAYIGRTQDPNPVSQATLTITSNGQSITIAWEGDGSLHTAINAAGPYTPVEGATNPYTTTASDTERYFLVK